jgi:hypothetical protein
MQPLSPVPATNMKTEKERLFADGRGGKGVGEEPIILYNLKKAWFSKNLSILSAYCKRQRP